MLSPVNRTLDVSTSYAASIFELGRGWSATQATREPEKPLELYEFESCPFCRKTREALSELDISPIVFPCPPGGERYRKVVMEKGGKKQFPFLVDPNENRQMYESVEIVRYLSATYGDGTMPGAVAGGPFGTLRAALVSLPRSGKISVRPSKLPEKILELYSFETSPYCRIAREALCNLELPYRLHNVAKNSKNREAFVALSGKMMVPYLIDPNTGTSMFESADITSYLYRTYGA
jgi:glutathione S-transferase